MESLINQMRAFAITIGIGMVASFCYDYYRVIRGVFRLKKIGTCVGDVIFWLITTAIVFLILLLGNWGEVRLYVLIGLSLGALIYFRIFSETISRLVRLKFFLFYKIWEILVKAVLFLWAAILFPFRLFTLILSYPVGFLSGLLKKAKGKLRAIFYNLVGSRVERGMSRIKSRLAFLAFWKRKKD